MERRALKDDPAGKAMLLATLAMLALGVVCIHSAVASVNRPGAWYARVDVRHTIFAGLALVVLAIGWRFDYRLLARGRRWPVAAGVMLIVALLTGVAVFLPGVGRAVGGYYRWIRIGPEQFSIGFQPSELIKLTLLVFLAAWLSRKSPEQIGSFIRTFLPAAGLILLAVGLVVTQDFGTAVLIGVSAVATLVLAGVRWRHLALLSFPAAAGFWLLVVQNPRRWARIIAMIYPRAVDNASTYQPQQALMAILSGGWFGAGPGRGIQKLGFLPEDSTDFVFAAYCEEWGFLGALVLLGLIVVWIYCARKAALQAAEGFGTLLAGSLAFLVGLQALLHIAVNVLLAPPTGVSLPFVSAGGTALILMTAATALIVSVSTRGNVDMRIRS